MNKTSRKVGILVALALILLLSIMIAVNMGYSSVPLKDVIKAFFGIGIPGKIIIIRQLRLPRILVGALCGIGLALSGSVLQSVTGNALADPGILGINAGAGIAVLLFLVFFPEMYAQSMEIIPIFAFIGGLSVLVFLYTFAYRNGKLSVKFFLTGGIGMAAGINAVMLILSTGLENSNFQMVSRWLVGSLWGTDWHHLKLLLLYLIVPVLFLLCYSRKIDMMLMGREVAVGLGVSVEREYRVLLFVSVWLAAACVSVCGGGGFIGLVSPHIAKRLVGIRHCFLLPCAMMTGALICVLGDAVGRMVITSIEIPVGIVVSVLSAPYFLYLLNKKNM